MTEYACGIPGNGSGEIPARFSGFCWGVKFSSRYAVERGRECSLPGPEDLVSMISGATM